jgi:anti-sigma factor RsiW
MDRKMEFERSNAFVDGELDRNTRAEVLSQAAGAPLLARELAHLNRLKSVIEDSVDVPEIDLPADANQHQPEHRNPSRRAKLALAAGVALLLVSGIAWWFTPAPVPGQGVPVAWAMEAHGSWQDGGENAKTGGLLRPANVRIDAHVPDLSAAKLRIASIGELPGPDGVPALAVGYLGTRGCRVTLLVDGAPGDLSEAAMFFEMGGLQAMVWRAGRLRHLILAQGMDKGRFQMIAKTVHRNTLERLPVDEPTRLALAKSRASSPPCAA